MQCKRFAGLLGSSRPSSYNRARPRSCPSPGARPHKNHLPMLPHRRLSGRAQPKRYVPVSVGLDCAWLPCLLAAVTLTLEDKVFVKKLQVVKLFFQRGQFLLGLPQLPRTKDTTLCRVTFCKVHQTTGRCNYYASSSFSGLFLFSSSFFSGRRKSMATMFSVDWRGLVLPFAYLTVLTGTFITFSTIYRKRKACMKPPSEKCDV